MEFQIHDRQGLSHTLYLFFPSTFKRIKNFSTELINPHQGIFLRKTEILVKDLSATLQSQVSLQSPNNTSPLGSEVLQEMLVPSLGRHICRPNGYYQRTCKHKFHNQMTSEFFPTLRFHEKKIEFSLEKEKCNLQSDTLAFSFFNYGDLTSRNIMSYVK